MLAAAPWSIWWEGCVSMQICISACIPGPSTALAFCLVYILAHLLVPIWLVWLFICVVYMQSSNALLSCPKYPATVTDSTQMSLVKLLFIYLEFFVNWPLIHFGITHSSTQNESFYANSWPIRLMHNNWPIGYNDPDHTQCTVSMNMYQLNVKYQCHWPNFMHNDVVNTQT